MSAVHRAAAGFGSVAEAYHHGRPRYPDAAITLVTELVRRGGAEPLVDLAAGSGIFTHALVGAGLSPFAIEPVEGMRSRLRAALPHVRIVAATAEALPVRDRSLGAVTVAQAFHWFDGPRAVRELARTMRAGAPLAIVFNVRRSDDALQAALEEIWEPYRGDTPTHRSGAWRSAFEGATAFAPFQLGSVEHEQVVDGDGLVDRVVSVSFIATLPDGERARVADRTRALLRGAETASLPYRTDVWWTSRA